MNARFLTIVTGAVGAAVLALSVGAAEPQTGDQGVFNQEAVIKASDDTAQAGVQPQAHGPVHEAFAGPTADRPQPGPVVPKQPPDAIEEMPPAEKPEGDDVQWIGGYWSWDEERSDFLWVTGIWRAIPPGRQWVPGHWTKVQDGYQWAAGFWAAADGGDVQVVPAPPDPLVEAPPDLPQDSDPAAAAPAATTPAAAAPGAAAPAAAAPAATTVSNSTFVPGNYVYQDSKFVWQPGYYVANRPGFVWVPARYVWTPAGYVFVEGYWDYDLAHRGLLFAPVIIEAQYLAQADWTYTPAYVVHDLCLLDALFVRTDCGCYYFGDYFDTGYARLGFVSWNDYRYHKHGFDPLFGYYRWAHRGDRNWERGMRGLYAARVRGLARPPRTLAQQQTLAQGLLANKAGKAALERSIMLGPVKKVDRSVVKLQTLDKAGQLKHRNIARQQQTVSRQRDQAENRLLAQGQSAIRKGGTAQTLALNLPKSTVTTKPGSGRTPPPPSPVKRTGGPTVNAGANGTGNRPGSGTNPQDLKNGRTNLGTNNAAGNPVGTKVNANAGNPATPQGGTKVNANNTLPGNPNGGKVNANNNAGNAAGGKVNANGPAGNPEAAKVNANAGNVGNAAGTKPNATPPGPGNGAGTPLNAKVNANTNVPAGPPSGGRVNGTPGNGAGAQGGAKVNATPPNPAGTPGGNRPAGGKTPEKPAGNALTQVGANGGSRPGGDRVTNDPPVRFDRVNANQNVLAARPTTVANPTPARVFSAQGGGTANFQVQRTFTTSNVPRVNNPTPTQFATPPSRPAQTFASAPQRTSGGGGGGGRRR